MRYFFMKQDISLPCAISYRDFDITGGSHVFTKEDAERLNNSVVLYLLGNGKESKVGFFTASCYHVFTAISGYYRCFMNQILSLRKLFLFIRKAHSSSDMYRHLWNRLTQLEARRNITQMGSVKRLVLDGTKIKRHNLFFVNGAQRKDPVASLALVESILRRKPIGIHFEEVEIE